MPFTGAPCQQNWIRKAHRKVPPKPLHPWKSTKPPEAKTLQSLKSSLSAKLPAPARGTRKTPAGFENPETGPVLLTVAPVLPLPVVVLGCGWLWVKRVPKHRAERREFGALGTDVLTAEISEFFFDISTKFSPMAPQNSVWVKYILRVCHMCVYIWIYDVYIWIYE